MPDSLDQGVSDFISDPAPDLSSISSPQKEDKIFKKDDSWRENDRKHFLHWLFKVGLGLAFIIAIATFFVRVWHILLPHCDHWLTDDEVQAIDKYFFSGAVGGFIGKYLDHLIKIK